MTSPWVHGTKAPVHDELDVTDLPVEGVVPPELDRRLVRMTPNPIGPVGDDHVWFVDVEPGNVSDDGDLEAVGKGRNLRDLGKRHCERGARFDCRARWF